MATICLPRLAGAGVTLVVTADTEGHVTACRECPHGNGLGGLDRRATALRQVRGGGGDVLVLDAGNALFGAESIDSGGAVIVDAYNALGYDAVNLTPRDFRLGKAATVEALGRAKFAVVSANLVDDGAGVLPVKPFVVKKTGGARVAIVGVSEPPAGLDYLPHLKAQLAGVRIRPVDEAVAEWVPRAKAEADEVVLLYYGSAKGLRAAREKFGGELSAVCVGGVRPDELPAGPGSMLLATSEHGKHLARATLEKGRGGTVEQVALDDSVPADEAMAGVVAAALTAAQPPAAKGEVPAEPEVAANPDGAAPRQLMRAEAKPLEPAAKVPVATEPVAPAAAKGESPSGQAAVETVAKPPSEKAVVAPPAAAETKSTNTPAAGPKFCTNCGNKLTPGAKFCTHCGAKVAQPAQQPAAERGGR
jgi:hypothetical protein